MWGLKPARTQCCCGFPLQGFFIGKVSLSLAPSCTSQRSVEGAPPWRRGPFTSVNGLINKVLLTTSYPVLLRCDVEKISLAFYSTWVRRVGLQPIWTPRLPTRVNLQMSLYDCMVDSVVLTNCESVETESVTPSATCQVNPLTHWWVTST